MFLVVWYGILKESFSSSFIRMYRNHCQVYKSALKIGKNTYIGPSNPFFIYFYYLCLPSPSLSCDLASHPFSHKASVHSCFPGCFSDWMVASHDPSIFLVGGGGTKSRKVGWGRIRCIRSCLERPVVQEYRPSDGCQGSWAKWPVLWVDLHKCNDRSVTQNLDDCYLLLPKTSDCVKTITFPEFCQAEKLHDILRGFVLFWD